MSRFHAIQVYITLYKWYSLTCIVQNKINNGTYAHVDMLRCKQVEYMHVTVTEEQAAVISC